MSIDKIITTLVSYRGNAHVFNPWLDTDPLDRSDAGPVARIRRLRDHLHVYGKWVLIGEAPGYQGCHFSGVPFTNERLICEGGIPRVTDRRRFTTRRGPWSEPSATIVWSTLWQIGIAQNTVLWNAFAWHPHEYALPYTNRKPSRAELASHENREALTAVLDHFSSATIIAVGQVAEQSLRAAIPDAAFECVRHPAYGGATEFRLRLTEIIKQKG